MKDLADAKEWMEKFQKERELSTKQAAIIGDMQREIALLKKDFQHANDNVNTLFKVLRHLTNYNVY